MALASRLAESVGDVLVVAAEKMSAVIQAHPLDQNTAILFGDGAGAVLISSRSPRRLRRILYSVIHTDGQFRQDLAFDWKSPLQDERRQRDFACLAQDPFGHPRSAGA